MAQVVLEWTQKVGTSNTRTLAYLNQWTLYISNFTSQLKGRTKQTWMPQKVEHFELKLNDLLFFVLKKNSATDEKISKGWF